MFNFDGVIANSLDDQSRRLRHGHQDRGLRRSGERSTVPPSSPRATGSKSSGRRACPRTWSTRWKDAIGAAPSPRLFPEMATVMKRLRRLPSGSGPIASSRTQRGRARARRAPRARRDRGHGGRPGQKQDAQDRRRATALRARACRLVCGRHCGRHHRGPAGGAGTVGAAWGWHGLERLRRARPDHLAHAPIDLLSALRVRERRREVDGGRRRGLEEHATQDGHRDAYPRSAGATEE